jgi:hypothetical protein
MSDLTSILVMTAIGVGQIYLYWFVDRTLRDRLDVVVSGVVRGVAVSNDHRRLSLWLSYSLRVWGAAGGQIVLGIFWLVAANNAAADDVRLLLYVAVWITFVGAAGWIADGVFWHRHLASMLRQSEAE